MRKQGQGHCMREQGQNMRVQMLEPGHCMRRRRNRRKVLLPQQRMRETLSHHQMDSSSPAKHILLCPPLNNSSCSWAPLQWRQGWRGRGGAVGPHLAPANMFREIGLQYLLNPRWPSHTITPPSIHSKIVKCGFQSSPFWQAGTFPLHDISQLPQLTEHQQTAQRLPCHHVILALLHASAILKFFTSDHNFHFPCPKLWAPFSIITTFRISKTKRGEPVPARMMALPSSFPCTDWRSSAPSPTTYILTSYLMILCTLQLHLLHSLLIPRVPCQSKCAVHNIHLVH